jgi:beta-N-acetylhexosaminidase
MAIGITKGEKIGQLLIFGFDGPELSQQAQEVIKSCAPGGVLLHKRNFHSTSQLQTLIGHLQAFNKQYHPASPPLFIAVDQEGGTNVVVSKTFTPLPTNMAMGNVKKLSKIAGIFGIVAQELHSIGINMILGPCIDVNDNPANPTIGLRSFGSDPETVAKAGRVATKALIEGGLIPVAKHFPGHGNTDSDSRLGLPRVKRTRSQMDRIDLMPFRLAIKKNVPAIMTAHVHYSAFDPSESIPATCSYNVISKLLRHKLGFDGLVISDDLEMAGFRKVEGLENGMRKALVAGVDMFLVSRNMQHQIDAVNFLKEAINTGEVHLSRIEKSVEKIILMKYDFFNRNVKLRRKPGSKLSLGLSKQLFDESVKVVKKTRGYIPIKTKTLQYIYPNLDHLREEGEAFDFPKSFVSELRKKRIKAKGFEYPFEPTVAEIDKIVEKLSADVPTILFTFKQEFSASRKRLYAAVSKAVDIIQVGISDPYDNHSKSPVFITTYGYHDFALAALVRHLIG